MSIIYRMPIKNKLILVGVSLGIGLLGLAYEKYVKPLRHSYLLPNGQTVRCGSMMETSKGNFYLSDCDDGSRYYVQGTITRID